MPYYSVALCNWEDYEPIFLWYDKELSKGEFTQMVKDSMVEWAENSLDAGNLPTLSEDLAPCLVRRGFHLIEPSFEIELWERLWAEDGHAIRRESYNYENVTSMCAADWVTPEIETRCVKLRAEYPLLPPVGEDECGVPPVGENKYDG